MLLLNASQSLIVARVIHEHYAGVVRGLSMKSELDVCIAFEDEADYIEAVALLENRGCLDIEKVTFNTTIVDVEE